MKNPTLHPAPKKAARLTVRRMPLAQLKPHPKNPRTHPEPGSDEWKALRKSLEHDYFDPIVWNKRNGLLVSGHLRTKVLKESGFASADCVVVDYDEPVHVARMIAANRGAGADDPEALNKLLQELDTGDIDIGLAGFTDDALAEILANLNRGDEHDAEPRLDEAQALRKKWKVSPGQLWALGNHRLLCGDAEVAADVALAIGSDKPHLMVTDPPYGVEYDASWRKTAGLQEAGAFGKVSNDDRVDWTAAWKLFLGDVAYVWHAGAHASEVQKSLEVAGFVVRSQIIWGKQQMVIGRGDYHWKHEPCWYVVRKGKPGRWASDRKQVTLWDIDKPVTSETGHSTQKPLECMARPIRNNSKAGDCIYEPFLGSGTTLIACENLGRKCRAIEINPAYVAVALQRFTDAFPGKDVHQINATGQTKRRK